MSASFFVLGRRGLHIALSDDSGIKGRVTAQVDDLLPLQVLAGILTRAHAG